MGWVNRMKDRSKVKALDDIILTTQDLDKFKNALQASGYDQLVDLCTIIMNTGIRINEILELKYVDINYSSNSIAINSIKSRTQQQFNNTIRLNVVCMGVLSKLQSKYPNDVFVFQSRNSRNQKNKPASPVSRQFVMKGFKTASDSISLAITIGSLRRNYATHMAFIATSHKVDHKYLSQLLGHDTKSSTESYINYEYVASPKNNLDLTNRKDAQTESLLAGKRLSKSIELSDISKKSGISESDLQITLQTIKKLKKDG